MIELLDVMPGCCVSTTPKNGPFSIGLVRVRSKVTSVTSPFTRFPVPAPIHSLPTTACFYAWCKSDKKAPAPSPKLLNSSCHQTHKSPAPGSQQPTDAFNTNPSTQRHRNSGYVQTRKSEVAHSSSSSSFTVGECCDLFAAA